MALTQVIQAASCDEDKGGRLAPCDWRRVILPLQDRTRWRRGRVA
jgi:hypothetical protein